MTGAAGRVGRIVVPGLRRESRLPDLAPTEELPGEWVTGSVTDAATMAEACDGVDAVIHLAGIAGEDTWDRLMEVNVGGTRTVLEAARVAGVPRVALASSVHTVGFRPAGRLFSRFPRIKQKERCNARRENPTNAMFPAAGEASWT